jgi:stage V sporulation protein B
MKLLKSTIITFFSNIFIFSISIITTLITSRLLGPEGKGILAVGNNTISISLIILGFGIAASNVFFIGKEKKDIDSVLGINIFVAFFSFIVITLIYFINSKYQFNILFKGLNNRTVAIVLLIIPFFNLKSSLINILLGLQDIVNYNKINIIDNIISLVLLIIFIFIYKSAYWVFISNLISAITVLVLLFYILVYKNRFKISFNLSLFKNMVNYGVKAQLGNAIQFLNYRLDIFIISYLLPISQVGIYSISVALGETMWKISGTVSTMVLPMTTNSKNKSDMKDLINKVTRITFSIVFICSILIVPITKPIISFLGKDFKGSLSALILLIPGISIFSICNILSSYIAGIGLVEKNIIASTVSCIATVILDFILIPIMGINGASVATSISYILATIITLYFYIKITGSNIIDILIIKKEDIKEIKLKIKDTIQKKLK